MQYMNTAKSYDQIFSTKGARYNLHTGSTYEQYSHNVHLLANYGFHIHNDQFISQWKGYIQGNTIIFCLNFM